jgi:hypothetical protein
VRDGDGEEKDKVCVSQPCKLILPEIVRASISL